MADDDQIEPRRKVPPETNLIQTKLPAMFFNPLKWVPYLSSNTTPTAASLPPPASSTISTTPNDISKFSLSSNTTSIDPSLPPPASSTVSIPNDISKFSLYPERRSQLARERPPTLPSSTRSSLLAGVASETKSLLPTLLASAPNAPASGYLYHTKVNLRPLSSHNCPCLFPSKTRVRVVNADSLDTALALSASAATKAPFSKPVLVLNMANAQHGGGGWLKGALAQEEAICYRSSLSFTLKRRYYPIPDFGGIYSPSVLIMRESLANGHNLLDLSDPTSLPVVSIVSVAAVRDPEVIGGHGEAGRYKYGKVRLVMKEKMRVVLRIAAGTGHRSLVLAALGCGAFGNPRGEVVLCWKEVLEEREFSGGWWEQIVFAVLEEGGQKDGTGNFGVFWRQLHGIEV